MAPYYRPLHLTSAGASQSSSGVYTSLLLSSTFRFTARLTPQPFLADYFKPLKAFSVLARVFLKSSPGRAILRLRVSVAALITRDAEINTVILEDDYVKTPVDGESVRSGDIWIQ